MTLREQPVHTVPHFGELFCSTRVTPPVVEFQYCPDLNKGLTFNVPLSTS
eukprot:SAG22_NODE_19320_length_276_cov_0.581921_1_plen_49_part_10